MDDGHIVAIVQARLGSVRLPAKVLEQALDTPMIEHLLTRLARSNTLDTIVLAVPESTENDALASWAMDHGQFVYRGSEYDVLDRYRGAAEAARADIVVRITGDCPLIDPEIVDEVVNTYLSGDTDYVGIADPPTFPDGLDTEVFSRAALEIAWNNAVEPYDREHVTPYLRRMPEFRRRNVANDEDLSDRRWTLDEPEDLVVLRGIFEHFGDNDFSFREVDALQRRAPELFSANSAIRRDEGAGASSSQKLWTRAKRVIPGGSMLLSKRPEMLLPERWPAYFSRARGCLVWDLDGREYVDVGLMGVGTNILGYGDPRVDQAVARVVQNGNLSTLNAPEEVYLAEALVSLHPWAQMVRFARSGGEACAVAVRIARAASGRSGVAFCGYHGWHDWYLAANLQGEDALGGHHLAGLDPAGVPSGLAGSSHPFVYNRLDQLHDLVSDHEIGVIFMEVERSVPPAPGFLRGVRDLATERGIVLVFDECTSGFRKVLGGLHLHHGVEPDIAVFGKTLGNGYAVTAIVGRADVMQYAQETFISSTFWTERIGSAAGLAAITAMTEDDAPARIDEIGAGIAGSWRDLAASHGVVLSVSGLPALSAMTFASPNHLAYKTLIAQEMLDRGHLATNALYASVAHAPAIIERYLELLDRAFALIAECEDGRPVEEFLRGPVCQSGFSRLA